MFPSGDYKRFEIEIVERYKDYDIPITFGILIADYRQRNCSDYIINYLNRFDRLSGKCFDFFIPGYSYYSYRSGIEVDTTIKGEKVFFSRILFEEFIEKLEKKLGIKYCYDAMLVLVEIPANKKLSKINKKIIIPLSDIPGGINLSGILFEQIFKISKKYVSIDKYSSELKKMYIKKDILDEIIDTFGPNYIKLIKKTNDKITHFKVK